MSNRIRQLREESHMTQVRLGMELDVTQETISAYENERHYPSFPQLVKLSSLFDASIDYIMGLSNVRYPTPLNNIDDNLLKLIGVSRLLTEKQIELVFAYIQGMMDMSNN